MPTHPYPPAGGLVEPASPPSLLRPYQNAAGISHPLEALFIDKESHIILNIATMTPDSSPEEKTIGELRNELLIWKKWGSLLLESAVEAAVGADQTDEQKQKAWHKAWKAAVAAAENFSEIRRIEKVIAESASQHWEEFRLQREQPQERPENSWDEYWPD